MRYTRLDNSSKSQGVLGTSKVQYVEFGILWGFGYAQVSI